MTFTVECAGTINPPPLLPVASILKKIADTTGTKPTPKFDLARIVQLIAQLQDSLSGFQVTIYDAYKLVRNRSSIPTYVYIVIARIAYVLTFQLRSDVVFAGSALGVSATLRKSFRVAAVLFCGIGGYAAFAYIIMVKSSRNRLSSPFDSDEWTLVAVFLLCVLLLSSVFGSAWVIAGLFTRLRKLRSIDVAHTASMYPSGWGKQVIAELRRSSAER